MHFCHIFREIIILFQTFLSKFIYPLFKMFSEQIESLARNRKIFLKKVFFKKSNYVSKFFFHSDDATLAKGWLTT